MSAKGNGLSGLARIDDTFEHPLHLFRQWHDDARVYNHRLPNALCLSTVSKDNKVSARTVVLREFDDAGFVIVTDKRSRKVSDIESNPDVAMTFLWLYINQADEEIARQVRVEGTMRKLLPEEFEHIYEREPTFCKIRAHICKQGKPVDWDNLKRQHDEILEEIRNDKNDLPMPDHFVGYKLIPNMMEFYYAKDQLIGDRKLYEKDESGNWKNTRIAA